eukprot:TRINITY_DN5571_c0_g1_i1.p2 TRINITY_DN5571_c0_g1~~TRINITY_DN5571_c0_g1_i1.p2  ORF type:complete len:205 (-),score=26.20 TRINITY_DN5571_c0_g1_i1:88-702(-)
MAARGEKRKDFAVKPSGQDIQEAVAKKMRGEAPDPTVGTAPLRWLRTLKSGKTIHDLPGRLTTEHGFVVRSRLPKASHFSTSRSAESPKQWGHIVTVRGHHLAYVIGYQPSFSRTHGFIFVFSLHAGAGAALGPVSATVSATDPQDAAALGAPSARLTWAEVPHAGNPELEHTAGLFPVRLFTSRKAEGRPHERAVEVTIRLES